MTNQPESGETISNLLARAVFLLEAAGIDHASLEALLLMAFATGRNRAGVVARLRDTIPDDTADAFIEYVRRRAAREPLQYITGRVEFCGLTFHVTPAVLIPRPETELLVEDAVAFLKESERVSTGETGPTVADIGTGSGCIAMSIAHALPASTVKAVDLSESAIIIATGNALALGVADRVEFLHGDLFAPLRSVVAPGSLDLIVSNPPYIPAAEVPGLQEEVLMEPVSALDGGESGLDIVRRIITEAPEFLRPGGRLMVEIGFDQSDVVRGLVEDQPGLSFLRFIEDFAGIERILVASRD